MPCVVETYRDIKGTLSRGAPAGAKDQMSAASGCSGQGISSAPDDRDKGYP